MKQDVRGRGGSGGVLDMNAMQEQDGYDAVEWAAALPGSNGKVGMIGALESRTLRVVRRDRAAATPRYDRPDRRHRRSAAHRPVHRHGLLAHDRAVAVPDRR